MALLIRERAGGHAVEIKYARCAAIDISKTEIAVCVRSPGKQPGERIEQIRKFKTYYGVLTYKV